MVYSQVENKGRSNSVWQIGRLVGSGKTFMFAVFFVLRKSSSSSTIRDKKKLEEGRIFQVWNFFPVGIKVEKGRSKLIIRDNTQAGDWPIYVKLKLS